MNATATQESDRSKTGEVFKVAGARLTNSERAYIRGLIALKNADYGEAHRQLSGYLRLSESCDAADSTNSTNSPELRLNPQTKILTETLNLFLAIQRESAILETAIR